MGAISSPIVATGRAMTMANVSSLERFLDGAAVAVCN
jgi:hypothetical protein